MRDALEPDAPGEVVEDVDGEIVEDRLRVVQERSPGPPYIEKGGAARPVSLPGRREMALAAARATVVASREALRAGRSAVKASPS